MAKETDKEVVNHSSIKTDKVFNIGPQHRPWLFAAAAVVLLLIVFALGASVADNHRNLMLERGTAVAGPGEFNTRSEGVRHFRTGGGFGAKGEAVLNGQANLVGVVTSVSGDSFTVGGSGATTNVTTSSSTKYTNGSQVKQNDTVAVTGTISNSTITATDVVINP